MLELNEDLTKSKIPTDFLWLDIEHTDSKMYFTFDNKTFPDPSGMLDTLIKSDRQLVTIVDPHYKIADSSYEHEIESQLKELETKEVSAIFNFILGFRRN